MANADKFNKADGATEYNRKARNKEVLDAAKKANEGYNGYGHAVRGLKLDRPGGR